MNEPNQSPGQIEDNIEILEGTEQTENERGASLVEYALLVALIAVVCIVAVRTLGGTVSNQFVRMNQQLSG